MEKTALSVDEFLAELPDDRRDDMIRLDALIAENMPGAERVLWTGIFWGGTEQSIIGYGAWTYVGRNGKGGEWFRVGLAAQTKYYSVYVNASADGQPLTKQYGPKIGASKVSAGAMNFTRFDKIDLEGLAEVIALAARAGDDGKV